MSFHLYGVQFHPEVYHSTEGKKVLHNFLVNVCGCHQDWTPAHFITDTVESLKSKSETEGSDGIEWRGGFHRCGDLDPSCDWRQADGDICRQWRAKER